MPIYVLQSKKLSLDPEYIVIVMTDLASFLLGVENITVYPSLFHTDFSQGRVCNVCVLGRGAGGGW